MGEWRQEIARHLAGLRLDPAREMEIVEELTLHVEARYDELRGDGMGEQEAREAALASLDAGDLRARLAPLRQADAPEPIAPGAPGRHVLPNLWRDLRLAVRVLRARPAFTGVAVLTLALGLGANTAIFSAVHAVLLRPLPYHEPDNLVFLWSTSPNRPKENLTPGRLVDFAERTKTAQYAGFAYRSVTLTGRGAPERLGSASVGSAFFDVLGVDALHGRVFRAGSGGKNVAVLTHRVWTRVFNADPAIMGSSITLNGTPHTVTGVMPESFMWPSVATVSTGGSGPDVFTVATRHEIPDTPVVSAEDMRLDRHTHYLRAVARVHAGVTLEEAQAEVSAIAAALEREYPATDARNGAVLVPARDQMIGDSGRPLLLLLGAVTLVLLIACANVANLLMGRAALRQREFEVRLALGAGRGRLMQQLLVESAVLALAGAVVGMLVASWSLGALVSAVPEGVLRIGEAALSRPVLLFSFALAAATAGLFGILPAWQASRLEGRSGLRDDGRTVGKAGRGRARTFLVAAEVAVAIALVVGASLLVRSFVALQRVDLGLDVAHMLTFDLVLTGERAKAQATQVAFYERVLERIRAIPGVAAAGMAVTLPIGGDTFGAPAIVEGRPLPPDGQDPIAGYQMVSPDFFEAAGVPFVAGRDVSVADTRDRPRVAVINEAFAAAHWPGESAIGKRFRLNRDPEYPRIEVVGIVRNLRHNGPEAPPRAEFYLPYTQSSFSFMAVVVKAHGDPASLSQPVRQAVMSLDAEQPISRVMTMEEHLRNDLAEPRFLSQLTLLFGALALTLAAIGIYGVMAWSVAVRTREFGVKLALGARPSGLLGQVLKEGLLVVAAGTVAGLLAAAAISRVIQSLLFETSPTDAATYVAAAAIVFTASLVAIAVPAHRATRVDPMRALRSE